MDLFPEESGHETMIEKVQKHNTGRELKLKEDNPKMKEKYVYFNQNSHHLLPYNSTTIEHLYENILYMLTKQIHEYDVKKTATELVNYMKEVFEMPEENHLKTLKNIENRKQPQRYLNVEVIKAENLLALDCSGLSDPYVSLYIQSNPTNSYNTTVIRSTLNPSWKQQFVIPILDNPGSELLVVEVWDFDAAESVGEKLGKLSSVKGIEGLKRIFKEIALTASTGKHKSELIGRADIPLKGISTKEYKSWYSLQKSSRNQNRGSILLNLYFSTEKNKQVAINEHQNLLRIFILNANKLKNRTPYQWCPQLNISAQCIIKHHSMQNNLSEFDDALCQWEVFTKIHDTQFLSLSCFNSVLRILMSDVQIRNNNVFCEKQIWEGYKKILPSCFLIIRSIRSEMFTEIYGTENLSAALEIIKKTELLPFPEHVDLFPIESYGWLRNLDRHFKTDATMVLRETITVDSLAFLSKTYEKCRASSKNDFQYLNGVLRNILYDLQMSVEFYDNFFLKCNVKYTALLFALYRDNIYTNLFPKIIEICTNLGQLNIPDKEMDSVPNERNFEKWTSLFDLYLGFKRFTNLGLAFCLPDPNIFNAKLYDFFYPFVGNWLNITVIKTLKSIKKAIQLDSLLPDNNTIKYTTSALDVLSLFYQIKYFWEQLDWPNIEESYLFVEKIVNDICRCCIYYANVLFQRLSPIKISESIDTNAHESKEFCYAINDINYIKESLPSFLKELKMDLILKKIAEYRNVLEAERCSCTISNIICETVDIMDNIIFELVEIMAQTVNQIIRKIFEDIILQQNENSVCFNSLIGYLEKSLNIYRTELQSNIIVKLLSSISNELSLLIYSLIQHKTVQHRNPFYFESVLRTLSNLFKILKLEMPYPNSLSEMCDKLNIFALETEILIHKYYEEKMLDQIKCTQNKYGQLSIKVDLEGALLQVHVLNAFQLQSTSSEKACNSYVKIYLTPSENFVGAKHLKTSVRNGTRYPLYDEKFHVKLSPKVEHINNGILIFFIKSKNLFGLVNHHLAECYFSFGDIQNLNGKQIRLNLIKPTLEGSCIIEALSLRTDDRNAKEFLRKLKSRCENYCVNDV